MARHAGTARAAHASFNFFPAFSSIPGACLVRRSSTLYRTATLENGLVTWLYRSCSGGMRKALLLSQHVRCMPSTLTAFSIKQWLLQRLFTALAVLRTSQSHLETEESLCPIPLATYKITSSVWMEEFLFRKQLQKSLSNQYRRSKRSGRTALAKALSVPRWKDGKNILPSKERNDNFQLQAFQCVIL